MTKLLGLDIGTTGVRCVAIDERGDLVADASEEYPLYTPQPGWSEQRPEDWWQASQRVIANVAARIGRDLSGIGLAGQMHGAVFLDQKDAVIRPALLWNDQRTEAQCQAITERVGARRLTDITGNPARTDSVTRTFAKDLAALTAVNPITGNTDPISEFLADPVEMKLLHVPE